MKPLHTKLAALLASVLLAACGGGGSANTTPKTSINSVKVFGDSLQDSGTFGIKFTVQGSDSLIYAERVAAAYGQSLCNFYLFTGTTFIANPKAGCTNFAIGGGRVNYTGAGASAQNPLNIGVQMATYAAVGTYSANDLVIIDGGGNDAADLVGAYLAVPKDKAASYSTLLANQLTQAQIGAALLSGDASKVAALGNAYMVSLADKFAAQIQATVLGKGAQYVVVMNMPGVTNTPRFQMVLAGIKAAAGQATRDASEALFKSWIEAFNAELNAKLGSDSRVAVIDFYTAFNDQIANPAQYGLTNVTTPACPAVGVGSDGLPTYDFPTCTTAALSAKAGTSSADWWKTYAFSDSFHPTPYGHQLVQQLIAKTLATRGWL